MKVLAMFALLSLSAPAQAAYQKISCKMQWKNTQARPLSFYMVAQDLGTARAKLIAKNPVDNWLQYIFGLKSVKNDFDANSSLIEMATSQSGGPGAEYRVGFEKKNGDLLLTLDDNASTQVQLRLYRNSGFQSGFIKIHCDPSYCGDFDYYANLSCKISTVQLKSEW